MRHHTPPNGQDLRPEDTRSAHRYRRRPRRGARLAEEARHQGEPRGHGPLRHRRGQGLRRLGHGHPAAGQDPGPASRSGRAVVEDRLVRSAHAGRVRRRPGTRDAGADGSLGTRLRQLGHLRPPHVPPVRSFAARVGQGGSSGPRRTPSSSSAPRSRSSPPWRCTTRTPATASTSIACRSSRQRRRIRATSSRRASAGRCAASAAAMSCSTPPPWRSAERLAASKDASARWVGKDAVRDLSRPLIAARVARSRRRPRPGPHVKRAGDGNQRPPVTSRNEPVVKADSSDSSHSTACATSSGCPPRRIGTNAFTRSTRSGSPPLACIPV